MSYQELLLKQEWKDKRLEILARDKNICTKCNNDKIERMQSQYGILTRRSTNSKRLIFRLENGLETSIAIESFRSNGTVFKNIIIYHSDPQEGYLTSIAARRVKKDEINELVSELIDNEWIFVNNLHVHHTYYLKTKLPWEYENNSLQTLCWDCHENLHKDQIIPVYIGNEVVDSFTLCKRCFGAGQIPEYNHVQQGICFRCNGAKYEELINV